MQNRGNPSAIVKRYLLSLFMIYYALFTFLSAAEVKATLSTTEVVTGNAVELRIEATGNSVTFPRIEEVGGVRVVGRHQEQSSAFSYINGQSQSKRTTTLTLSFIPQNDMTVPAFSVTIEGQVYKTDPIALKVVQSAVPSSSQKFSLMMRADKKSVMVGESLLVTVFFSLQNGVRISENPQYTKPEFKGFFVKEIEEQKQYLKDNRQVTELKYLLTAKEEGNFTIAPATAKIGVADTSRRDLFGRFFGTLWRPIASNSVAITVKPTPYAVDLVGSFTINATVDKQIVKANTPVNVTVQIKGKGSLEDFEFPEYEIDGVTVYADDAKVESKMLGGEIESSLTKRFAFISDHNFTIPSLSMRTYEVNQSKVTELTVPSYTIEVKGKQALTQVHTGAVNDVVVSEKKQGSVQSVKETKEEAKGAKGIAWWMLVVAFVLGAFVSYLLIRWLPAWKRTRGEKFTNETRALQILSGHLSSDSAIEEMVRKLYARKKGDKSVVIEKRTLKEMVEKYRN